MSSVSPFLISVFVAIRGLGLLPSIFRLGFGFVFVFFFFLEYPSLVGLLSSVGLVICCFFFFFRLVLLSHLLFRIDVGL